MPLQRCYSHLLLPLQSSASPHLLHFTYHSRKSTPFFLPFPNQFLLLHHRQYWSLQPVQKLRLGTPILFPLFSLTFRNPRTKTLFFKALLKSSIPKTVTMLWKTTAYPKWSLFLQTSLCICAVVCRLLSSAGNSLVSALVAVVIQNLAPQILSVQKSFNLAKWICTFPKDWQMLHRITDSINSSEIHVYLGTFYSQSMVVTDMSFRNVY